MSYHRDDPNDNYDYRQRQDPFAPPRGLTVEAERAQVPAILLIMLGILNLLGGLALLGCGMWVQGMKPDAFEEMVTKDDPNALDDLLDEGMTVEDIQAIYGYGGIGFGFASWLAAAILILGGARMMALKWYGFAIVAALTAIVSPSGCCLFGVIGGIWALIVLLQSDVRESFG